MFSLVIETIESATFTLLKSRIVLLIKSIVACGACEDFFLSRLYCVVQCVAYNLVACALRERRRVYAGYGHYVQLGELGNRVVVEAVVGLYGQEFEANVLVALNAVYENVERVGNVVREVARGDVRLFENVEVRPFVSVIACRYAQFRRRAVPCYAPRSKESQSRAGLRGLLSAGAGSVSRRDLFRCPTRSSSVPCLSRR